MTKHKSKKHSIKNEKQQDKRRQNADAELLLIAGTDPDLIARTLEQRYHLSKQDALKAVERQEEALRVKETRKSRTHKAGLARRRKEGVPLHMNPELQEIARESVRGMRLFDDLLFQKCMSGNKAALEAFLRPILKDPGLQVRDIQIQRTTPADALEHGVHIDVEALTSFGKNIAVEVRRGDGGASPGWKRAGRAREDSAQHPNGEEYKDLRDVYVVMLCENDPFGADKPMYHVRETIEETGKEYADGLHTIFTNGQYRGDDALGQLMHDMRQVNAEDIHIEPLRDSVRDNKAFAMGKVTNVRQETAEQEWFAAYEDIIDRNYGGHIAEYKRELAAKDRAIKAQDRAMEAQERAIEAQERAMEAQDYAVKAQEFALAAQDHTITELRSELARMRTQADSPEQQ